MKFRMERKHCWSRSRTLLLTSLTVLCVFMLESGRAQFSSIKTVNFDVMYQHGIPEQDAKRVADFLQTDYDSLRGTLGLDFKKRLDVRVYDAVSKFSAQTGRTPSWRGAIYLRGVLHVQPVQALVMRKIFEQSLSFELALALLDQAAEKGCPRWLREAFAVYHSGVAQSVSPPTGVRLASFSDLEQDLQTYPNPPQRNDVQYILASTIRYFVQTYGEQNTMALFKAFDGHSTFEQIVSKGFAKDIGDVEKAWAQYIVSPPASHKK